MRNYTVAPLLLTWSEFKSLTFTPLPRDVDDDLDGTYRYVDQHGRMVVLDTKRTRP